MNPRGDLKWAEFWNRYCRKSTGFFILQYSMLATLATLGFLIYQSIQNELLLRELKRTGEVAKASEMTTWVGYLGEIKGPAILYACIIIASLHLGLFRESKKRHERIIDLPWQRLWPWIFVIATIIPGILIYPVSAVNLMIDRHRRKGQDEDKPGANGETQAEHIRRKLGFEHDLDGAKTAYRRLQIEDRRHKLETTLETTRRRLETLADKITETVAWLKESQQTKGVLLAEVATAEEKLANFSDEETPEEQKINDEFKQLMELPGVIGVRVRGDAIGVLVLVILKHGRASYFQGIWEIQFGRTGLNRIVSLQSGVKARWSYGRHPDYRDYGYGFCMGSREEQILDLARNRKYPEALALLINSMSTINPGDESFVPDAFEKVR